MVINIIYQLKDNTIMYSNIDRMTTTTTTSTPKRFMNRWTVNELLSLQREYELLEMTVPEIAEKHQRTVNAILYKLQDEGLIDSWTEARGMSETFYKLMNGDEDEDEEEQEYDADDSSDYGDNEGEDSDIDDDIDDNDDEQQFEELSSRVLMLEQTISELSNTVNKLLDHIVTSNSKPKQKSSKLRQYLS